jgi:pyruvate formate lyase activating enzyme
LVKGSETAAVRRLVLSVTRMTVHNGPGIRTVILVKGCPLHCIWCSTPESQKAVPEMAVYPGKCIHCDCCVPVCPSGAIRLTDDSLSLDRSLCDGCGNCAGVCHTEALKLLGQEMTVRELVDEAKRDSVVYKHSGGGVTVSGGEPLLDTDFILALLRELKEAEINVGIDTCGYVPWENIEPVLSYTDFLLWDLKIMDEEKHREYTGVSNRLILDNMRSVSERGTPIYIRIPVIPGYNDSEENLRAVCEFARGLPSLVEIDLLPLHHLGKARYASLDREYPIDGIPLIPDEVLRETKLLVESCGLHCEIIG